ncbi:MAG: HIT family protein [Patescibacteria group bacterium]|jgi:histidine triad (HIT) family protein
MNDSCIFCCIIAGTVPAEKVYEDEGVIAFLDIHPIRPGHTLVVPKVHSTNLLDAEASSLAALSATLPKLANAVIRVTGSTGCNIGINNGASAGQTAMHLHVHVIPRIEGDGLVSWGHSEPTSEALADQARAIREAMH